MMRGEVVRSIPVSQFPGIDNTISAEQKTHMIKLIDQMRALS